VGSDNWLADELSMRSKKRKWVYIVPAVGFCLLICAAVLFSPSNKPVSHSLKNVAATSQNGSTGLTEDHQSEATVIPASPAQATTPSTSAPSMDSSTPTVQTQPKSVQVDCSAEDSEYLGVYKGGVSSLFVDLSKDETTLIDTYYNGGDIVPLVNVVGYINTDISDTNNSSQNDYDGYVSTVKQAYQVPACSDISQCVYEIPSVP
jgi:hypothetical protein